MHQFTEGMVQDRDKVLDRPGIAIVHNIDGFGTHDQKKNIYVQLVYHRGAGTAAPFPRAVAASTASSSSTRRTRA